MLDCPKQIGNWAITRVYIDVLYPDNTTKEVDCVRTGNVWVGTFEGSTVAGKVTQGYQIKADGVDENENAVSGYVLSCGDVYILEDTNDLKALVGKTAMRYLDDIPATPSKGDTIVVNGALKIYDGSEWFSFDLRDYYNKEQIDAKVSAINHNIDEVNASVSAMGNSITQIGATVQSVSARTDTLESNVTTLSSSIETNASAISAAASSIATLTTSLSAMGGELASVQASLSTFATKTEVSGLATSVSVMASTVSAMASTVSANTSAIASNASAISTITSNLSSYATISYVDAQIGAMLSSQL